MKEQNFKDKRVCVNCGSDKTYISNPKNRPNTYPRWYNYKDGRVCHKCRWKLIDGIKHTTNQIAWTPAGRRGRMRLKDIPRKGICDWCGKKIGDSYIGWRNKIKTVKRTNIHHFEYHANDPLKDTVELCNSCHSKETRRLEKHSTRAVASP